MKVEVLICTFRRPFLAQTLASVAAQVVPDEIQLSVIVADNDVEPSARALVMDMAAGFPFALRYIHAPDRNISVARNACLDASQADFVVFLDDDETAPSGWIAELWQAMQTSGADAVFAPARALYPPSAPTWITKLDYHSNWPERRDGHITTGHTCNAILRWHATTWQTARFDPARGRSGGEDTAFFFALRRMGALFEATDRAEVMEPVAPARLTLRWLARRKFRMGQSYASSETTQLRKVRLAVSAAGKAGFCGFMALIWVALPNRRNFWALRGCLHCGVVAGYLTLPEPKAYGT